MFERRWYNVVEVVRASDDRCVCWTIIFALTKGHTVLYDHLGVLYDHLRVLYDPAILSHNTFRPARPIPPQRLLPLLNRSRELQQRDVILLAILIRRRQIYERQRRRWWVKPWGVALAAAAAGVVVVVAGEVVSSGWLSWPPVHRNFFSYYHGSSFLAASW